MTRWMTNHGAKLHNTVQAPAAVARDTLLQSLRSVPETASLLYAEWWVWMREIQYGWKRLKDIVEKEAREGEENQAEENIDLTTRVNRRVLKWAYRSFVISETPKADFDGYFH